jgi:hypothetical protein
MSRNIHEIQLSHVESPSGFYFRYLDDQIASNRVKDFERSLGHFLAERGNHKLYMPPVGSVSKFRNLQNISNYAPFILC